HKPTAPNDHNDQSVATGTGLTVNYWLTSYRFSRDFRGEALIVNRCAVVESMDVRNHLAWVAVCAQEYRMYQGDIETNRHGVGHGRFIRRFNIETFIVSPASEPSPIVFNNAFPDVPAGPKNGPVHTYHLGLWFNSPQDAQNAG